jgi:hypothetical protein
MGPTFEMRAETHLGLVYGENFLVLCLNWTQILKIRQALVKVHIVKYTILWKSLVSVLDL